MTVFGICVFHDRQCVYMYISYLCNGPQCIIFHQLPYTVKIAQCKNAAYHVDARTRLPSQQSCRNSMDDDKSRLQRDIKELFGCKLGIESDKITERKVSANSGI